MFRNNLASISRICSFLNCSSLIISIRPKTFVRILLYYSICSIFGLVSQYFHPSATQTAISKDRNARSLTANNKAEKAEFPPVYLLLRFPSLAKEAILVVDIRKPVYANLCEYAIRSNWCQSEVGLSQPRLPYA